jgi:hypothetical protein
LVGSKNKKSGFLVKDGKAEAFCRNSMKVAKNEKWK